MKMIFGMFVGAVLVQQNATIFGWVAYATVKLVEWFPFLGVAVSNV